MKKYLQFISISVVICFAYSCEKSDGITRQATLSLSLNADSNSFAVPTLLKGGVSGKLFFGNGNMLVNSYIFDGMKEGLPVQYIAPAGTIDLFSANQNIYSIGVSKGSYDNVYVKVKITKSSPVSFWLQGLYTSSTGINTAVTIAFNENITFLLRENSHMSIDELNDYTSSIKIYLSRLFAGLTTNDLDRATKVAGIINISISANAGLYARIKKNMSSSFDSNGIQVYIED